MIVGIDSMVLIYAGKVPRKDKGRTKVLEELQIRAKILFHHLRNATIVLPTIAVAEILVPVPQSKKGPLVAALSESFLIPQFDLQAASIAAELWAKHKELPRDLKYSDRQVLRADSMIIAAVKAARATVFYSHDRKCRNLAAIIMEAKELPKDDPDDMFLRNDIERGEF